MRLLYWIDRNLWSVPALVFLLTEAVLLSLGAASRIPILLCSAKPEIRQQLYSSLSSTASSLLGFAIAAVAILAAFNPRRKSTNNLGRPSEKQLSRARGYVSVSLLATALFLLILLVTVTFALSLEPKKNGSLGLTSIVLSSATASLVGLLASGVGLALAIVERTQEVDDSQ